MPPSEIVKVNTSANFQYLARNDIELEVLSLFIITCYTIYLQTLALSSCSEQALCIQNNHRISILCFLFLGIFFDFRKLGNTYFKKKQPRLRLAACMRIAVVSLICHNSLLFNTIITNR